MGSSSTSVQEQAPHPPTRRPTSGNKNIYKTNRWGGVAVAPRQPSNSVTDHHLLTGRERDPGLGAPKEQDGVQACACPVTAGVHAACVRVPNPPAEVAVTALSQLRDSPATVHKCSKAAAGQHKAETGLSQGVRCSKAGGTGGAAKDTDGGLLSHRSGGAFSAAVD
uniref:Uncharacterized protein n=1 Tax=Eutreptiella gymnastica TaxID=73025 RepID=A0A7S4D1A5_9EUGL|mmetsp:Transcript_2348/g.4382  ORF Transcript_2348/g.4382 Transcript_2348/m.4382 type:complete len:166 (+) Transcript_2348:81-578(+)